MNQIQKLLFPTKITFRKSKTRTTLRTKTTTKKIKTKATRTSSKPQQIEQSVMTAIRKPTRQRKEDSLKTIGILCNERRRNMLSTRAFNRSQWPKAFLTAYKR